MRWSFSRDQNKRKTWSIFQGKLLGACHRSLQNRKSRRLHACWIFVEKRPLLLHNQNSNVALLTMNKSCMQTRRLMNRASCQQMPNSQSAASALYSSEGSLPKDARKCRSRFLILCTCQCFMGDSRKAIMGHHFFCIKSSRNGSSQLYESEEIFVAPLCPTGGR